METDSPANANTSSESSTWTEVGMQSCEICCIQFTTYKEWLQHNLVQHKDDEGKIFKCDQCEESFGRKVDLVCHKLTHSEEKTFRCDECGEKFSRVEVFIGHMNSHIPEEAVCPIQSDLISQSNAAELTIKKEFNEEEMETENGEILTEKNEDPAPQQEKEQEKKQMIQLQVNVSMVNDHICDICGQCFDRQFLLVQHKEIHVQAKLYFCEKCNRSFRTEEQFSRHMESEVHEKTFRCEHCECFFTRKGNLKRHMVNIHPVKKPYKCQECEEGFHLEEDLKRHIKNHIHEKLFATQEVVDPSKNSLALTLFRGLASKFHKCDQCGKVFNQKGNLARHRLTHTGERRYKCNLCDKAFFQRSHLEKHLHVHENKKSNSNKMQEDMEDQEKVEIKKEMCHICGELFEELRRHMFTHKIYSCKHCQKEYNSEEEVLSHEVTHTEDEKFTCDICEKEFKTERRMLQHHRRHEGLCERNAHKLKTIAKDDSEENSTGDNSEDSVNNDLEEEIGNGEESEQSADSSDHSPQINSSLVCYPCKECGKVLSSESNLKRHMRTHKEDKPHACIQCGKLFISRGNLSRHMLIHTGEKPFKCGKCGKAFSQRPHLKKHLRKMHEEDSLEDKVLSYIHA